LTPSGASDEPSGDAARRPDPDPVAVRIVEVEVGERREERALDGRDVGLALEAGDDTRVPLPFANAVRQSLLEALAADEGNMDWAGLAKVAARRARLDP